MMDRIDYTDIKEWLTGTQNTDISTFDAGFLTNSILRRLPVTNTHSVIEYKEYPKATPGEASEFINSLHINYSEFFRNPFTYSSLERVVIPLLISDKQFNGEKEIRIWSAGCASGQDAYSMAILMDEILERSSSGISYRIFATDINREELARGRIGLFNAAQLKNVTIHRLGKYFTPHRKEFLVDPRLKQYISFSYFDLLSLHDISPPESIFGSFDIVICSNLLYYYRPAFRKRILLKTTKSLVNGGYLVTSETERDCINQNAYHEVFYQSAIFRKKTQISDNEFQKY